MLNKTRKKRKLPVSWFLTGIYFLIHTISFGQNVVVDSLYQKAKDLTYSSPDSSYAIVLQAMKIAKETNYRMGIAAGYRLISVYHSDITGNYDLSGNYLDSSYAVFKLINSKESDEGIGAVLHNYAVLKQRRGSYPEAMELYQKAARFLDSIGNTSVIIKTYNNLSTLYVFYQQFDKAIEYASLCIKTAEANNDLHIISVGNITLAAALIQKKQYAEALPFIQRAGEIAEIRNDHYIMGLYHQNMCAYYYYFKNDLIKAIEHGRLYQVKAELTGNLFEELRARITLSEIYYFTGNYKRARQEAEKCLEINSKMGSRDLEQRNLYLLGKIQAKTGESSEAVKNLLLSIDLRDSLFKEENSRQINFLEATFQKEKQELHITKLEQQKKINDLVIKRRTNTLFVLIIISFLLLSSIILSYRMVKQRNMIILKDLEIEKEKVNKLEKEKQLVATQSVLIGEETERRRLARDIHDGLGGLLSGIKLKLKNMKGNFILDEDSKNNFDNALYLLDTSVTELRRIAHNMMPESLIKFGLKEALTDFCSGLGNNETKVSFRFYGEQSRTDQNLEITAYRIVQELVNNALKHSGATEIVVQIVQEPNRLNLNVQDNGKGFDTELMNKSKTVGLNSVKSRVAAHNGIVDIVSQPDTGTEISVEFRF
jgi:two-component system, NarL family, sensor kinase